jgi:hypothetical protein
MWINDGSLAKQSYARAFAWSNESTFQKRGYIQYLYIAVLFSYSEKIEYNWPHASVKIANKNTIQHCKAQQLAILVIQHVILLQQKRKKNTKYHKHCIVSELTIFVFKSAKTKKKSRIGLLHRNQFPEGIQLT